MAIELTRPDNNDSSSAIDNLGVYWRPVRGGLAPCQIARILIYIESHIDATIRVSDLAKVANLSALYFPRAFRLSFNRSPHAYLMRRRIARAQVLMLRSAACLGQIAAECGLSDQAHFSRLFRRFLGETPGAWRTTWRNSS
jgi:AraC family transcriptional regulator